MVKTKKRIEKSIESFDKLIQEHKDKIEQYTGNKEYLQDYWKKQILTFEAEKQKQESKLKKK